MNNQPDFDTLRHLSDTDPAGFFAERTRLIEEYIASVPPERAQMLREFQARIDATRLAAGTPGKAVENLMGMLSDHLHALLGHTVQLAQEARGMREAARMQGAAAAAR